MHGEASKAVSVASRVEFPNETTGVLEQQSSYP